MVNSVANLVVPEIGGRFLTKHGLLLCTYLIFFYFLLFHLCYKQYFHISICSALKVKPWPYLCSLVLCFVADIFETLKLSEDKISGRDKRGLSTFLSSVMNICLEDSQLPILWKRVLRQISWHLSDFRRDNLWIQLPPFLRHLRFTVDFNIKVSCELSSSSSNVSS